MRQRIWLLSILAVCVVAGIFAATYFMGNRMSPTAVAQVKEVTVEQEEFVEIKQNRALLRSLGHEVPEASDEQLIERLLTPKLIAQEAERRGLSVPEADIDEQIASQRDALEQIDPDDEQEAWILPLMAKTYEMKGVSEEQHWQSERTREGYRHGLYLVALRDDMVEKEEITSEEQFDAYKQSLYDKIRDEIVYNYTLLDQINVSIEEPSPL
ncbi:hypothetical protein PA598K_03043 [Paenibacillus sp. 598K]|uniref:SurA N-terminal domain-containing protein n=1 Tax=Paenibacillus sp. 598K TaxID=1117987 RepID=UPI000FF97A06|nr:SurA N-terminal domain-containing protein [Paenibacillus sp. 598K]GBF74681.1 hypothetical protein PA598K_03043 [Paenibacillus sp. 598K]